MTFFFIILYVLMILWTLRMLPFINLEAAVNLIKNLEDLVRRAEDWLDRIEKETEEYERERKKKKDK